LTDGEVAALVESVGQATVVTYAPPNVYPMSAPVFEAAHGLDRGTPPAGPLGVYVHVPFCNYKCTFCFYATRSVPDHGEMARYVAAVERELSWVPEGAPLVQLYVGGGTPTALPPDLLDRLLRAVLSRVERDPAGEVHTVECSPESVTDAHLDVLRSHGIERVSMGVQSMQPEVLAATDRRHDAGQVAEACRRLVGSGTLLNVDLIYGLPRQTEDGFRADFERVAGLGVHSVTAYNLRVNERTPIGRLLTDQDRLDAARLVRWREAVREAAERGGFERTRWHTFRRREPSTARGAAVRFRDVTGQGDQFGAGQSARSRLSDVVYRNHRGYGDYLSRVEGGESPVEEVRRLDETERRLRHVALTLGDGAPLVRADYEAAFGTAFEDDFAEPLARLLSEGVVEDRGDDVAMTERGSLVYDLAMRAFYPEAARTWIADRQRLAATSAALRSAPR
jgi:oxygen-independent coproporphyrinogen-3 oxidase